MTDLPVHYLELESVYAKTVGKGVRTLAVTSANSGEGVSMLSYALVRRGAAAGLQCVLIDFNMHRPWVCAHMRTQPRTWLPADGSVHQALIETEHQGLFLVGAPAPGHNTISFRDPDRLRRTFTEDLADFDLIVCDTSAVNAVNHSNIPAESIAAPCDAALMVVLAGRTSEVAITSALEKLNHAGVNLVGTVFNDQFNPPLADELCRELDRMRRVAPRLVDGIKRRIRRNPLFRVQI